MEVLGLSLWRSGATVRSLYDRDRGGGDPPPCRPHPQRRYPHGPLHGKIPENNRIPTLSRGTAFHRLSPRTAPAPRGGGGGRRPGGVGSHAPISGGDRGGGMLPPPRQPHPQWRYPLEIRFRASLEPYTCLNLQAPRVWSIFATGVSPTTTHSNPTPARLTVTGAGSLRTEKPGDATLRCKNSIYCGTNV